MCAPYAPRKLCIKQKLPVDSCVLWEETEGIESMWSNAAVFISFCSQVLWILVALLRERQCICK